MHRGFRTINSGVRTKGHANPQPAATTTLRDAIHFSSADPVYRPSPLLTFHMHRLVVPFLTRATGRVARCRSTTKPRLGGATCGPSLVSNSSLMPRVAPTKLDPDLSVARREGTRPS